MTLKRLLLGLLTLLAIVIMGNSLIESWSKPQIQSQLELRQTDLLLQASLLDSETSASVQQFQNALLGKDPIKAALRDYEKARQQTSQIQSQVKPQVAAKSELSNLQARLALRIGILQTQQQAISAAITTWKTLETLEPLPPNALIKTASVLTGLWQESPDVVPQAESLLQANLTGWFRYQALARLYNVTQQTNRLLDLQTTAQTEAQQAMTRLITLAVIPSIGVIVGGSILLILILQALFKGKTSLLASLDMSGWSVPWDGEVVWQVFILGFFWLGQFLIPYLLLPALFSVLQISPSSFGERDRALWILINYIGVALAGLLTLYGSIKPYHPLSSDWFRLHWRSPW
ncbi:MAG: CPBP family intramembrane glutamate endopeptidase, partial [Cyanobacteriota bacterium SKYGB_h_bin112]|nr:CPBP family intramembrane glutamate endopeptidase [Cyanobacteriota bacterium SKYGB_h_bin112]